MPHFGHVVLDKGIKMTADQYKNYIDKVLNGDNYWIFRDFFDVLKSDPIFLVSGNVEQAKQRLDIVGRQIDFWIKQPDQIREIDFSTEKFARVFSLYEDLNVTAATDELLLKIDKLFDTCQIRSVKLANFEMLAAVETKIVEYLVGKPYLEELVIVGYNEKNNSSAMTSLCTLLLHPQCRLKSLKITAVPIEQHSVGFTNALLNMECPLENIEMDCVVYKEVADAIFELSTKRSLKRFYSKNGNNIETNKRILFAIANSSSLEDCQIFNIDATANRSVYEDIANNLSKNGNLTTMTVVGSQYDSQLLNRMLSVPSLRAVKSECSTDFGFLENTPLIQSLDMKGSGMRLAELLQSDTCQLQYLTLFTDFSFLDEFGASLVNNKSLQRLKLCVYKEKKEIPSNFGEFVASAIENRIPLRELEFNEYLRISPESVEKIVKAIIHHPYLERVVIGASEILSEQAMENLIELVNTNKVIKKFYVFNYGRSSQHKWSDEQKKRLIGGLEQSDTLQGFATTNIWGSDFKLKNDVEKF